MYIMHIDRRCVYVHVCVSMPVSVYTFDTEQRIVTPMTPNMSVHAL